MTGKNEEMLYLHIWVLANVRKFIPFSASLLKRKWYNRMAVLLFIGVMVWISCRANWQRANLPPTTMRSRFVNPLLRPMALSLEHIYERLLNAHPEPSRAIVVEVGVFDGSQCRQAAEKGFHKVICVEPSPANYDRSMQTLIGLRNVELVQVAAGNLIDGQVEFHSIGGTGDHAGPINPIELQWAPTYQDRPAVKVPMTTLDVLVGGFEQDLYLIKIDTQGFDGFVLEGMHEILQRGAVQYVIFELWPSAMHNAGKPCAQVLNYVLGFEKYSLYELSLNLKPESNIEVDKQWLHHPLDPERLCAWYERLGGFNISSDMLLHRNSFLKT